MELTDAELVAGVRGGSREAAGRLAERYLRASRAVALSIVGEVATAEDICQDAFVYAIERIDDCRDPARFGGWLLTIVRSRSHNNVRNEASKRSVPIDEGLAGSGDALPDRNAELAELRDRLLSAMENLREAEREVVLLHDLEGWTHVEIAERLELPPGTVRSHLHYARKKLRSLLRGVMEE